MKRDPVAGQKYRKKDRLNGNKYRLLLVATDTETATMRVVYQRVDGTALWDMPLEKFKAEFEEA